MVTIQVKLSKTHLRLKRIPAPAILTFHLPDISEAQQQTVFTDWSIKNSGMAELPFGCSDIQFTDTNAFSKMLELIKQNLRVTP